jgi:hypothetical protein
MTLSISRMMGAIFMKLGLAPATMVTLMTLDLSNGFENE